MTRILALLLVLFVACKKDESLSGADAKKTMGHYATGYNALLNQPKRLVTSYFSAIPDPGKLDGKSKPSLGDDRWLVERSVKEAREAFAAGAEAAPESLAKLDAPAKRALAAVDKLVATYGDVYNYYNAESYKDDAGKKGVQLHAQMVAGRDEFQRAMTELGDGLSSLEDLQADDEIAKHAGDKDYGYWFRFYTQQAKKFLTVWEKGDDAALPAAEKALATVNDQLLAFTSGKGTKLNESFKTYAQRAIEFAAEARKLVRLVGGKHEERELRDAGDALVRAYNALVSMGNTLVQLEAQPGLSDS